MSTATDASNPAAAGPADPAGTPTAFAGFDDVFDETTSDIGQVHQFECTRAELFAGDVRVGDDIDPSRIIEHAVRYTSITIESSAGGRVVDIWRTSDLAVVHDATAEGSAPGVVVSQELLEFQVAALMAATIGELKATRVETDLDDDGYVLMIGSGSAADEGPKVAVVNTPTATYSGIAAPGINDIDVVPASAVTAWAMIVEALRSSASTPS